ncbi:hypothetical protein SAMN05216203_2389 [Marinobacter daqiaonensis]|uniref:SprT-like family protein n=1 Tax=Marinobacter daqiaonensis TaxID=650891 RepID=A0A1I6IJG6_9GAMM|nr:hypothetical protein [Marinobacter daqiaonensis]SFR66875.1 hypothetical protein SAMN05216203_2389 [Marinobacter daqiaonensis]
MPALPETFNQIAQLMCQATHEVLWSAYRDDLRSRRARAQLVCRVGGGRATYHRYDHRDQRHLITFGVKMVAAKQEARTAANWLSTREIVGRGYFGGEVSVLNLLAHTCIHEFAHLLQLQGGKRYHGSVHNRHFYRLLDELNGNGSAGQVRRFLADAGTSVGIALDTAPMVLPARQAQAAQWQRGDHVEFGEGPQAREGVILRINRKTCTVEGAGLSRGLRFRVPFVMLRAAA